MSIINSSAAAYDHLEAETLRREVAELRVRLSMLPQGMPS
jgi:hypothetical protein